MLENMTTKGKMILFSICGGVLVLIAVLGVLFTTNHNKMLSDSNKTNTEQVGKNAKAGNHVELGQTKKQKAEYKAKVEESKKEAAKTIQAERSQQPTAKKDVSGPAEPKVASTSDSTATKTHKVNGETIITAREQPKGNDSGKAQVQIQPNANKDAQAAPAHYSKDKNGNVTIATDKGDKTVSAKDISQARKDLKSKYPDIAKNCSDNQIAQYVLWANEHPGKNVNDAAKALGLVD